MDRLLVFLAGAGLGAWAGRRLNGPPAPGAWPSGPIVFPAHEAATIKVLARTQSVLKEIRALVVHAEVPDAVMEEKIRARILRTIARPDAVQVRVMNGTVSLRGTAREEEISRLTESLSGLRGVKAIENNLEALTPPFTSWDDAEPGSRFPGARIGRYPLSMHFILIAAGIALTYAGHRVRGGTGAGLVAGGAALFGAGASGLLDPGVFSPGFVSHVSESSSWRPGPPGSKGPKSVASP